MTHSIDEDLEGLLNSPFAPGAECLSIERLAELGAGDVATPEEVTHLERCVACAAEVALARSFHAPPDMEASEPVRRIVEALDERHRRPGRSTVLPFQPKTVTRWTTAMTRWATAAVIVLAVGILSWQLRPTTPGLPPLPETDVSRGSALELVTPTPSNPAAWRTLAWRPDPRASRYQVEVRRIDGELIWSDDTLETSTTLPEGIDREIAPGVSTRWRVAAIDASGTAIATSEWTERRKPLTEADPAPP